MMDTHPSREKPGSSKYFGFQRMVFCFLLLFIFFHITYWLTAESNFKKYQTTLIYPKGEKESTTEMSCGARVQNEPIMKVNNLKTYTVGSYIEHRLEVKKIRTIAIVLRTERAEYYCLICCNGRNVSAPASYDIHSDHFGFEYGTADIFCTVPTNCTKPTHVAITSRSTKQDGAWQDIRAFQPVKNQQKQTVFPYEFSVCISTMFDYDNVLMLVQAMEMYKILGVKKVAIYKTSCDSAIEKVLDYYQRENFVEVIPWKVISYINVSRGWQKSVSPGELHYFGQTATLNDCVYRYMYQSRYVALHDLDEFILPLNLKSWTELLPALESKHSENVGFEFESFLFPLTIKDMRPEYSPDSWKDVKGINILEHITRLSNNPGEFNDFKVIVNPRLVYSTTVHGFLQSLRGSVRVDANLARMYHMRNVSKQILSTHSHIQDTHHRDYAERLIAEVSEVLQKALSIQNTHNNR